MIHDYWIWIQSSFISERGSKEATDPPPHKFLTSWKNFPQFKYYFTRKWRYWPIFQVLESQYVYYRSEPSPFQKNSLITKLIFLIKNLLRDSLCCRKKVTGTVSLDKYAKKKKIEPKKLYMDLTMVMTSFHLLARNGHLGKFPSPPSESPFSPLTPMEKQIFTQPINTW